MTTTTNGQSYTSASGLGSVLRNKRFRTSLFIDDNDTQSKRIRIVPDTQAINVLGTLNSAATVDRTWTLPDISGTLAITPGGGGFVDTTSAQTITGQKTFTNIRLDDSASAFFTTLGTVGLAADRAINFPNFSGTVLLTSNVGTAAVDLSTNQTVAGVKTFSDNIRINNAADTFYVELATTVTGNKTATFPDFTGIVAYTTGAQTFNNKSLTTPVILANLRINNAGNTFYTELSSIATANRAVIFPDAAGTVALLSTNNVFTGTSAFGSIGTAFTAIQHGRFDYTTPTIAALAGANTGSITFPGGAFASAPKVTFSVEINGVTAADCLNASILGTPSTTTFVAQFYNTHPTTSVPSGSHIFIDWIAWI